MQFLSCSIQSRDGIYIFMSKNFKSQSTAYHEKKLKKKIINLIILVNNNKFRTFFKKKTKCKTNAFEEFD